MPITERALAEEKAWRGHTNDAAAHARAGVARRLAQLVATKAEVVLVLKKRKKKQEKKSSTESCQQLQNTYDFR